MILLSKERANSNRSAHPFRMYINESIRNLARNSKRNLSTLEHKSSLLRFAACDKTPLLVSIKDNLVSQHTRNRNVVYINVPMRSSAGPIGHMTDCPDDGIVDAHDLVIDRGLILEAPLCGYKPSGLVFNRKRGVGEQRELALTRSESVCFESGDE
jgi:hypothetical protein